MLENKKLAKKKSLSLIPLRDLVAFPHQVLPLQISRSKSIRAVNIAEDRDKKIFLVCQQDSTITDPEEKNIYSTGVIAKIVESIRMVEGDIKILVEGLVRAKIVRYIQKDIVFEVEVEIVEEKYKREDVNIEAFRRNIVASFKEYAKFIKKIPEELLDNILNIDDPIKLVDQVASFIIIRTSEKQRLLETIDLKKRMKLLIQILTREKEILAINRKIQDRIKDKVEKSQKEFYLTEQMKAIQQELGEKDALSNEINQLTKKIKAAKMTKEAEEKAFAELDRLKYMMPMAPEASVVRTYIDWLISIPWYKTTRDMLNIEKGKIMLDEDHYGLEKPKERILEYLAVKKLTKKTQSQVLCFVGPPGVGKTSLAKSIARVIGRKFVRISLGGVRDEAEIRGHRKTYVGSLPGKIIQAMKKAKTKNPVFLMDEIDKVGVDFRGDPSAALLEVLDPEQNNAFNDHYLEVDYDLSSVMFITTANVSYTILPALKDRMEIIALPGYTDMVKFEIARNFLIPKQLKFNGLHKYNVHFSTRALIKVIRAYTREAGVRNLERTISAVFRKIAKRIATKKLKIDGTRRYNISVKSLERYLGPSKFRHEKLDEKDGVGAATGLAWTEAGGELLIVETIIMKGKGKLTLTGQLGEVMQESAQAAISYIRANASRFGLKPNFYNNYDIHIHVPEGAVPKDGPSAGITIATSIISTLTGIPIKRDVAMTGEITLRGRVLPIGGLKEKLLAAYQGKIKTVIIPLENEPHLSEVPANIKDKLEIIAVDKIDLVFKTALKKKLEKSKHTRKR